MLNSSFAGRPAWPGLCGPAATGIMADRPGHDCDCAQAPVRLVACRAAGSRLVVSKIPGTRARDPGPVPVWLLATHAYPASEGWHSQFKFSWLSMEAHSPRDKSYGVADHGYGTQRDPRHRHSSNLNAKRAAGPG